MTAICRTCETRFKEGVVKFQDCPKCRKTEKKTCARCRRTFPIAHYTEGSRIYASCEGCRNHANRRAKELSKEENRERVKRSRAENAAWNRWLQASQLKALRLTRYAHPDTYRSIFIELTKDAPTEVQHKIERYLKSL